MEKYKAGIRNIFLNLKMSKELEIVCMETDFKSDFLNTLIKPAFKTSSGDLNGILKICVPNLSTRLLRRHKMHGLNLSLVLIYTFSKACRAPHLFLQLPAFTSIQKSAD